MSPAFGSEDLLSKLEAFRTDSMSPQELSNKINTAFREPMKDFKCLKGVPSVSESDDIPQVSESEVRNALLSLNLNKSPCPDCVPSWLLREYTEVLAYPVAAVLNSSFREQRFPQGWKMADVVLIPKGQLILDISKHLRPVSLTPSKKIKH